MTKQSVLVVDDDAALAENLAEIIAGLDVEVEVRSTGADALARATERAFDVALVDVRLPDRSGTDLIADLRQRSPDTATVMITGDATLESAIAAVRGGAFAYVLKPFSPPELLEIIGRALAQVALVREGARLLAELERSERRHREVVEAVPAFVLALDAEGGIALWNRRLEEVTGFSRAEMLGKAGLELVRGGGVRPLPVKGGGERMARWERAEVTLGRDGGRMTYAVGTDVTAEQEMLRRALRAERLAAVGTLAAGLAHEVRNPLNSAALQLERLERRIEKGEASPETLRPICGLVRDEIRRLERLVGEFLSFVHPRPLDLKPTDLEELCGSVLSFVQGETEKAGVNVAVEVMPNLQLLSTDPERLRQVLLNLVRNAIEAMPQGGSLTIRARGAGANVEVDVEDTGHGFADETPIFDAFYTTKPQGTGLGLAIVHRIVTDHGGTIRVRSRPGSTCFTISLPAMGGIVAP